MMRFLIVACCLFWAVPAAATNPFALVNEARLVAKGFLEDNTFAKTRGLLANSRAVIIIPSFYRGGFIVGGAGGVGVLLAKDGNGVWGYPAFVNVGAGSVGLQAGLSASEVMIFIQTDRALESLLNNQIRIGGHAGLAVATIGAEVGGGAGVTTNADFIVVSRSVGLFAGLSFEGGAIEQRMDLARNFYGQEASLYTILLLEQYQNTAADPLREVLQGVQ